MARRYFVVSSTDTRGFRIVDGPFQNEMAARDSRNVLSKKIPSRTFSVEQDLGLDGPNYRPSNTPSRDFVRPMVNRDFDDEDSY